MLANYLFDGNVWLIIGLVLILGEAIDGSLIVFLPTGISGLIVGVILRLQEELIIRIVLNDFIWALVVWSFFALGISIIIRNLYRPDKSDEDINDY